MTKWCYADEEKLTVYAQFDDGHTESHLVSAECIQTWIANGNTPLPYEPAMVDPKEQAKADLRESDSDMARIAEDLIATLISKGVIASSDLPKSAQDKLSKRSELRSKLK